jgi:ubiquinone/menaquinone biosynthesis C-methylase UbiE
MTDQKELPWTGERLVPSYVGDTAIEHLHRYAFAREYATQKTVLDIACGEGYGANLLADVAAEVIGVDIAVDAVDHANRKYGNRANLSFRVGSCTAIPLDSASVDVVVSFETLEHIGEQEQMLREIHRVLRNRGILVVSTPDKLQYTILPKSANPYHVRECFKDEFETLLAGSFSHVYMFEQRICHGSVVVPSSERALAGFWHYQGNFRSLTCSNGIAAALYNLAVATDDDLEPVHYASVFQGIDVPTEVEKLLADANRRASAAESQLQRLDVQLGGCEQQIDSLRQQVSELNAQREDHQRLRLQLQRVESDLNAITGSRAWAGVQRLRQVRGFVTHSWNSLTGGHRRA